MELLLLTILAYFAGSIPFGVIISSAHGKDLRKIGSGNIGATNLSRALGKKWGYFCFSLDVLKGFIPTVTAGLLIDKNELSAGICGAWLAVGIAAVMGHIFPVFLRFKGGKGVATSLGIALGIYPFFTIPAVLSFVVWAVVVLKYRYISLGSVIAAVVFPMFFILSIAIFDGWYLADLWSLLAAGIIIPVMVIIRHRKNITRILNGTESKIKK